MSQYLISNFDEETADQFQSIVSLCHQCGELLIQIQISQQMLGLHVVRLRSDVSRRQRNISLKLGQFVARPRAPLVLIDIPEARKRFDFLPTILNGTPSPRTHPLRFQSVLNTKGMKARA